MLSQERLKEILHYDPDTGIITWKVSKRPGCKIGDRAGTVRKQDGYRYIKIDGKVWKEHRIAFLYMYDEFPPDMVDHVNHNKADNRLCNLRLATRSQNGASRKKMKNRKGSLTSSKWIGVTWMKKNQKWQAQLNTNQSKKYLGLFDCESDATQAYNFAAAKYHGEFAVYNVAEEV